MNLLCIVGYNVQECTELLLPDVVFKDGLNTSTTFKDSCVFGVFKNELNSQWIVAQRSRMN